METRLLPIDLGHGARNRASEQATCPLRIGASASWQAGAIFRGRHYINQPPAYRHIQCAPGRGCGVASAARDIPASLALGFVSARLRQGADEDNSGCRKESHFCDLNCSKGGFSARGILAAWRCFKRKLQGQARRAALLQLRASGACS
jgi:hypothetical protein